MGRSSREGNKSPMLSHWNMTTLLIIAASMHWPLQLPSLLFTALTHDSLLGEHPFSQNHINTTQGQHHPHHFG